MCMFLQPHTVMSTGLKYLQTDVSLVDEKIGKQRDILPLFLLQHTSTYKSALCHPAIIKKPVLQNCLA